MPVANPVHAIGHVVDAAFTVECQLQFPGLVADGHHGGIGGPCRLEQCDHVVAVAQIGAQLQLAPGEVIQWIQRQIGQDLTGAGTDGDTACVTIGTDE